MRLLNGLGFRVLDSTFLDARMQYLLLAAIFSQDL